MTSGSFIPVEPQPLLSFQMLDVQKAHRLLKWRQNGWRSGEEMAFSVEDARTICRRASMIGYEVG